MSFVDQYKSLPKHLKLQLKKLESKFQSQPDVKREIERLLSKQKLHKLSKDKRKDLTTYATRIAILEKIKPIKIMNDKYLSNIYAYTNTGTETIDFTKIIAKGDHVRVIEGIVRPENIPVVVKFYESRKRDITYEMDIYMRMKNTGINMPYFSVQFKIWNQPVLVMEKLQELNGNIDEYEMGRQVIPQIKALHTFGIHNDIKPGNIMRRNGNTFLVIDYGGVAIEKLNHGYRRWIYSPIYCSQAPHQPNTVTTAKNDFIELCYTMKEIQNIRNGVKAHARFGENKPDAIRSGFTGKLKLFLDRAHAVDDRNITDNDYESLLQILS
jgi:hypothetical protein